MLQRIQSVFMFVVVLSGILLFFFPLATYLSELGYYKFYLYSIDGSNHEPFVQSHEKLFSTWFTLPLVLVQLAVVLLASHAISRFKSRMLQIKLNRLNIFLNVILVGGIFMYATLIENTVSIKPDYGFGNVLPLISIIALFLANYYIRKDERLIRSADRLR